MNVTWNGVMYKGAVWVFNGLLWQGVKRETSSHSVASLFLSLSVILWYCCSSVRPVCFLAGWPRLYGCIFTSMCVMCVCLGDLGDVVCSVGFMFRAHVAGYASRRAMLQQLHGVTMYSHDEHHTATTTTPYSWTERGKGASANDPSTGTCVCQSTCQSVL